MIDRLLAEKLVQRISKHIKNRVTIMDKEGIIIASSDATYIGVFHETARQLISSGKESVFVDENQAYPGAKAGANLTIFYKEIPVGVVGIAGVPDQSLMELGKSVRLSVESMLEYEMFKNETLQQNDAKNSFVNMLLYEHTLDSNLVLDLAEKIGYNINAIKLPILVAKMEKDDVKKVASRFECVDHNDMIFSIRSDGMLILKSISESDLYAHRDVVPKVIKALLEDTSYVCYVGRPQKNINDYYESFEMLSWLRGYLNKSTGEYFLADYAYDYCFSRITPNQARNFFGCIVENFNPKTRENYIQIIGALVENDMNIYAAANALGIHRNTFVFRLNKLRGELKLDPINNVKHQWLVKAAYMYMQKY